MGLPVNAECSGGGCEPAERLAYVDAPLRRRRIATQGLTLEPKF